MQKQEENEERALKRLKKAIDPWMVKISLCVISVVVILYILYHISGAVFDLVDGTVMVIGNILYMLRSLLWGFFVAYLLMPLTDLLQRKLANARFNKKNKTYRLQAVALTILIVLTCATIFFSVLISTFTSTLQIADLESIYSFVQSIAKNVGTFYNQVIHLLEKLSISSDQLQQFADAIVHAFSDYATGFGEGVMSGIENIPNFFSQFFFQYRYNADVFGHSAGHHVFPCGIDPL